MPDTRKVLTGCIATGLVIVAGAFLYVTKPVAIHTEEPLTTTIQTYPTVIEAIPYHPQASVYSAVRDALVAAGVDEDKIGDVADKVSSAIADEIAKPIDELRRYGAIAVGSLVPLWIIALVALFRHQKPPVDLRQVEDIVREARYARADWENRP